MREVNKHLQPFYLKRGICQLTDHEYDMSMLIFCKYLVIVLVLTDKMHRKIWYAGTCGINNHGLTI